MSNPTNNTVFKCDICGTVWDTEVRKDCPKCEPHDIAASNARQNEYWQRVGGHPLLGEHDE